LLLVAITFIFGIFPLTIVWPSGWKWHAEGHSAYGEMILGIYATLGVFLIIASRNPRAHRSLIWFAVWSSVVHGGIMAVQSVVYPHSMGHLWGDVLALFAVAAVLAPLTPWGRASEVSPSVAQQLIQSGVQSACLLLYETEGLVSAFSPVNSGVICFREPAIFYQSAWR
jgi:Family of unknown function (DUF6632)